MSLPQSVQQEVNKWAKRQGISSEEFVLQAITEKVKCLQQQEQDDESAADLSVTQAPALYRKEGVLVVKAESIEPLDTIALINDLREERIQELAG